MKRINTDPPRGDSIDIEDLVDAIDPSPHTHVVYPARNPNQRSFVERDPYDWIERNEQGEPI